MVVTARGAAAAGDERWEVEPCGDKCTAGGDWVTVEGAVGARVEGVELMPVPKLTKVMRIEAKRWSIRLVGNVRCKACRIECALGFLVLMA